MGIRKIIHLDLDAFFCAVEELQRPELRGKPFAVGGRPESRGVISSCSYAARAFGVTSAMPTSRAMRICPQLILLPGRHKDYSDASHRVMEILARSTVLIEQISIDEAFLDVSDLPQPGIELAHNYQNMIFAELQLPSSLGIATNKLVAKIATDVGKASHHGTGAPFSIREVLPGKEAEFLAPLPVRALPGVGPKTAERLINLGIHTIGDLAREPGTNLAGVFGKYGHELHRHAQGIDDSPVITEHGIKSISQEITFSRDVRDPKALRKTLRELAEQVGYRIRHKGLQAKTVRLKVRWPDFSLQTRQVSLLQPTNQDGVIYQSAVDLFDLLWNQEMPVRLIGIGVSGLAEDVHQLTLWDIPTEKERRLLAAVDDLKARYGKEIVQRGSAIQPTRDDD
jgi:DNA polymerase IV